jgi:hypothetical protein
MTWRRILFGMGFGYSVLLNVLLWQQLHQTDPKTMLIRDVQATLPQPPRGIANKQTRELVSASSTQFLQDFSFTLVEHCRSFHWVKEPTDDENIVRYSIWLEKF